MTIVCGLNGIYEKIIGIAMSYCTGQFAHTCSQGTGNCSAAKHALVKQ